MTTTPTEAQILLIRMEAAMLEREAAQVRLQTAHEEQESARKTLEMGERVARAMMRSQEGN